MMPSIKINRLVCCRMASKIAVPLFCCHTGRVVRPWDQRGWVKDLPSKVSYHTKLH